MDKKAMRKNQLAALMAISPLDYEQKCYVIEQRLFQTEGWKNSEVIAVTVSKQPEVNTWNIIKRGWEEGKKICVPKCKPSTKELTFYELISFTALEKVYYDLYEPVPSLTNQVHKEIIQEVIVPGLAYTKKGYRLGFGGGYYDRFLSGYNGRTLSLAFDEQMVDSLPVESFDVPVDEIITESATIQCG
ncbi:5-formyltetrahydrofolate cyclo-ligase [Bacillus sp. Marseille-Q1617]|uniref:5-formyltetrahydrofolate cyclo-ligase n=1 Tax=Bacillus sp. Marseille-Q1617 TaxID=2736887 RepID=UPI001589E149|nr:5-formyltetrahydrofolate cyclo-ligase [Bacillus sp. Marseille-Q1617]